MIDTKELRRTAVDCYWPTSPVPINEILDRLEAAEKSDAESIAMYRKARDERDTLRAAVRHEADCVEAAKAEIEALRAKIGRMEKRLRLILEEPENTMSNSKAMREMIKQARLALEESK